MLPRHFKLLIVGSFLGSFLLTGNVSLAAAQVPDGTLKVMTRMVAPGIGLSWGDGVLTFKGEDFPFTFHGSGLFRDVDTGMTAAELSGQVFNLKSAADLTGNYQKVEAETPDNSGARATMKNKNGVVVELTSTIAGRKFNLSREGLNVELKNPKVAK